MFSYKLPNFLPLKYLFIISSLFISLDTQAQSLEHIPIADTFFSSTYLKDHNDNSSLTGVNNPTPINYQAFTLDSSQSFKRIVINFFISDSCSQLISQIYVGSDNDKPSFLVKPGHWVIKDKSAYNLCTIYSDALGFGCTIEQIDPMSIQLRYVYADGTSYLGQCYKNDYLSANYGASPCTSKDCKLIHAYLPDNIPNH